MTDELRIYIVVRKDIGEKLSKAKFGVQCSHAVLLVWVKCYGLEPDRAMRYLHQSQPKIVVEVNDEKSLLRIHAKASALGFYSEMVTDAGRTELPEPTLTSIAIGPIWYKSEGKFLKRLRLYTEANMKEAGNGRNPLQS